MMKKVKICHYFTLLMAATLLLSCMPDSGGRKGRPLIRSSGSVFEPLCSTYYNVIDLSCYSQACPSGTHEADSNELTETINEINNSSELDLETKDTLLKNIDVASKVCVNGSPVLRPSGSVKVKRDFCACLNGKPDVINNCTSFCANTSTSTSTLFVSVGLKEDILLNSTLGNLENWCNEEIAGEGLFNPACTLEVTDGVNTEFLPISIGNDANNFTVNINGLEYEKPYVATLVESQSGSNARSDSFQIYRKKIDENETPQGPLKIMPVSQYSCITRSGGSDDSGDLFDNAARLHFYFPSNNTPPSMPPGNNFLICHDVNQHGENDSPLYDRLELIPQHFAVWDQSDIRFADQDGDGRADINIQFEERLKNEFDVTQTINIFNLFNWPNRPGLETTPPNVGFFMQPWIDQHTGRGFCPDQEDYNGNDPVFRIMKEWVGVNTEGIYLAEREPVILTDGQGNQTSAPQDVLIIREGTLKKIWFYYENNQHLVPDEVTSNSKTIHFYWPADVNDPYVRKSTQKIYTVRSPDTIGKSGETTGLNTAVRPPDKRFGCVPALD